MFAKMKIVHKLILLLAVASFGLIAMTGMNLQKTKDVMLEDRKATLKSIVEVNLKTLQHYYEQAEKGTMTMEAAKAAAYAAIRYVRYNKTDYVFGYDYNGIARITGPEPSNEGKDFIGLKDTNGIFFIKNLIIAAQKNGGYVFYNYMKPGKSEPSPKVGYALGFKPWNIMVGTGVYLDDINEAYAEERNIQVIEALSIILIVVVGGVFIGRSISSSLNIQDVVKNFEESVKNIVAGVSSAATEMQQSAKGLSNTAEETTRQANTVGSASESAAGGVQTVASAAEELNTSISEITTQTNETVRVALECVTEAERTSKDITELSTAAEDIESVVNLIENIANQVNLLALNATIEAARAGEAGKGFAVVANEVKNLATQTGDATKDIVAQVANIQDKTKTAVESIGTISDTIKKVNDLSTIVAAAAEEQGAATQEISRSVQQTAQDTNEVSQNIQGVKGAAEETNIASTQMLATADQLAQESETLRGTVEEFIGRIRHM